MTVEKHRILIVDDAATNIEILNEVLGAEYDSLFAMDGVTALRLAVEQEPDLILLDVVMPGLDGHEVCRRLKADPRTKGIPVIFISGLSDESDEAKGLEIGAIDYITKPFSPPIVRARVRNHLQLKRYQDMLERLLVLDGLTGIANRRRFDEALEHEWLRSRRQGTTMSLIIIDVDCFKLYNDNYGHAAGDECLKRVANVLAEGVHRPSDLVARYGGEEFVVIMPETDAAGAIVIAETLRRSVLAMAQPHAFSTAGTVVSVSIGGATIIPAHHTQGAEELVKLADTRLYEAKNAGRNRVAWAAQPDAGTPPVGEVF
ncbi:MAG TPA: diguanylate cyclase [Aliidongia sp.]|uniref:diguanylate cyclase n=1 Tax=Aliidongia sp. TaxID=1914230 RepID=UPI002DDD3B37|nr:diguanylate cyclase [Aliidongia sp.]HEV2678805.1 diguanylate cyclase [Aliidongia sp.]